MRHQKCILLCTVKLVPQDCHSSSCAFLPCYYLFPYNNAYNSRLCSTEGKKGSKIVVLHTMLPVGIRRLQGVNTRSDLSGEALSGDSTPPKHSFIYFYFDYWECHIRCVSRYQSAHNLWYEPS